MKKHRNNTLQKCTESTINQTQEIETLLQDIGFSTNVNGYPYLAYTLLLTTEHETLLKSVSKNLYPQIAEKFDTTTACVEHSSRHVIK